MVQLSQRDSRTEHLRPPGKESALETAVYSGVFGVRMRRCVCMHTKQSMCSCVLCSYPHAHLVVSFLSSDTKVL